jgi:hypothetical protein
MDGYLTQWLGAIDRLAEELRWETKYKVYAATDTRKVQIRLKELFPDRVIVREDAYFAPFAHPLVYSNLGQNNGGARCEIRWFEDPMRDLLLLAEGRALVTSIRSGFTYWPAISLFDKGSAICRPDPANKDANVTVLECQQRHVDKFYSPARLI